MWPVTQQQLCLSVRLSSLPSYLFFFFNLPEKSFLLPLLSSPKFETDSEGEGAGIVSPLVKLNTK